MNIKFLMAFILILALPCKAAELNVQFANNAWDGIKIPEGQQCQKFGGNHPATPELIVTGIPAGSSGILLEYSDRDSQRMNNGGHGRMRFNINSAVTKVKIPSVLGHTFAIPPAFTMIEEHRGDGWDKAGAYMPPCSGGKGHEYYLTIKTVKGDKVTAETMIEMGKY